MCGCIGIATVRDDPRTDSAAPFFAHAGEISGWSLGQPVSSQQQVEDVVGRPTDLRDVGDGAMVLTYQKDLVWRGLLPVAILPIPLLLPLAHDSDEYWFRDGELFQIVKHRTEIRDWAGCALLVFCWTEDPFRPLP
jgi:hypothetical protein